MGEAAALVIAALIAAAAGIGSAAIQANTLDEAQDEARRVYEGEQAQRKKEFGVQTGIQQQQIGQEERRIDLSRGGIQEQARQFDVSANLRREESGYERMKNQFSSLSQYADQNEKYKDLLIGRVSGLGPRPTRTAV